MLFPNVLYCISIHMVSHDSIIIIAKSEDCKCFFANNEKGVTNIRQYEVSGTY